MSRLSFDAVIFDCDGVLVDSEPITNRVLAEMLGELGWNISTEETMRHFVGKTVRDEAALIESRTGFRVTTQWLEQFRARRNAALEAELIGVTGAPSAVKTLHEALDGLIAVASGADRHKVEMQLAKVGIFEYFEDRIFSGQEMPRNKPHPDVYLAAARGLDVDPARCAIVEDTVTGATAGIAAGATVFAYCPNAVGHSHADAMKSAGVAAVFRDMAELPAVLARWCCA
jgi:HAD superfamily hydrolase (TIGR01509 family)